jgi:circadian clock protein KaiC
LHGVVGKLPAVESVAGKVLMAEPAEDLVATDVEGLDSVLRGGLPGGRLHLLQGKTGTGKTTLGLQFALAGRDRGEPTLFLSLAETETEIRGIAASHGWSLDGLSIFYHDPGAGADDEMQTVLPSAEFELPAALDLLLERVESMRPARLVIDSLSELRILAGESRWYRRGLMRMRSRLEAIGCTALLIDTTDTSPEAESYLGSVIRLERCTPVYGPDRRRLLIVKMRGHDFATGYHDVRIRPGGLRVYRRLVAAEQRQEVVPGSISTGVAALDAMLGGGLDEGTAVLLLGPTGTGKSTVALQCAIAAAERGEKALFYVFDERAQTVFQRAAGLGFDLASHVDSGRVTIRQIDPAELTPGEFAEQVRVKARVEDVRLVVLDSLNAYLYAMPEERLLNVHLHELLAHLSRQRVTSILVGTQRVLSAEPALPARLDVSYLADAVILFKTIQLEGGRPKTVTVYKRRAGRHDDSVRELHFTSSGVSIGDVVAMAHSSVRSAFSNFGVAGDGEGARDGD